MVCESKLFVLRQRNTGLSKFAKVLAIGLFANRNHGNRFIRLNFFVCRMDTLQRHMPQTGADGMNELKKIALRFEEKIYTVAISQVYYSSHLNCCDS